MHPFFTIKRAVFVFLLALGLAGAAFAQSCPTGDEAPVASVLHGTLVHHDELRIWIGLKVDRVTCGEREIQLTFGTSEAWRAAEALRNCGVTATGKLFYGPTGYYSADMAVGDPILMADISCHPFRVKPDFPQHSVPTGLRRYSVSITIDTRGKGHTAVRVWRGAGPRRSLSPWQAYTHFWLNGGGDLIWFGCPDSFEATDVAQVPDSSGHITRLGSDLGVGLHDDALNTITFVCRALSPSTHF
jgi:hypothetical protein